MKNIKQSVIEFFKNEDMQRDITDIVKPIRDSIYNELYVYIWFICIYNVLLLFLIVVNFFLLLKILHHTRYLGLPFTCANQ
jgi:hypothetical protein